MRQRYAFFSEVDFKIWGISGDKVALLAVLAIYAVMGAISFYEKGTDKTTAYFHHVGIILAIRDLWTKVQFEFLKELTALKAAADPTAGEPAARERIRALAEGFCNDLNKAATGELTEWRTEFLTSLSELETAAKKGSEDVTKQIQEVAKAAEKSAADAKTAAEKAAIAAQTAAKAAEDAAKPGGVNLTVTGDFDDEVVISVDGAEAARSRGKTIALERVSPGQRKISARAKKGTKELEAAYMVDVKPGRALHRPPADLADAAQGARLPRIAGRPHNHRGSRRWPVPPPVGRRLARRTHWRQALRDPRRHPHPATGAHSVFRFPRSRRGARRRAAGEDVFCRAEAPAEQAEHDPAALNAAARQERHSLFACGNARCDKENRGNGSSGRRPAWSTGRSP